MPLSVYAERNLNKFPDVLRQIDAGQEEKGKAFEKALKWWLSQDPIWSKVFEPSKIHLWEESPFRNGPDTGIDLTAMDRFGKVWAIQAKNWDPDAALPKSEIDSFLSASSTATYSSRLLVTTTQTLSANARRTIQEQEKPCVVLTYDELAESPAWSSFLGANASNSVGDDQTLFDYQEEAVSKVATAFLGGVSRGQLVMACGTGKTIVAQRVSERIGAKRILVLVPSLLLVQQTLNSWLRNAPSSLQFLAVCSDESVANDAPQERASDLPFAVTTASSEIASFLRLQGISVVFSTYQSSHQVAEAQDTSGVDFDLVISDEAHRLAGPLSSAYSTVLDAARIRTKRLLFMTATPKVYSTSVTAKAAEADVAIASMDDERVFGPVIHTYSFSRAIKEQRLMDYEVIVFGVSDADLSIDIERRRFAEIAGATLDAKELAQHFGLARAMEKYRIHRVISFHSRISAAANFARTHSMLRAHALPFAGTQHLSVCKVLTGGDPTHKRRRVLRELSNIDQGDIGLVTNARCLTEGIDVPSLDGVAFIDPKVSQVDIVQALGRAIRRSGEDKLRGHIIVPVFLTNQEIESGEMSKATFRHVFEVLNGLKAHDEAFTQKVDHIRTELGRTGGLSESLPKLTLDLPKRINSDFSEKIQVLLLRNITESWDEWFGKLASHIERTGSIRINQASDRTEAEVALAGWVVKQRTGYRGGGLDSRKVRMLEQLPGWSWDPFEESWWEQHQELAEFSLENGHCRVPRTLKSLYAWTSSQRGKRSSLTQAKTEALDQIAGWTWDAFDAAWWANYELLDEVTQQLGTSKISAKFIYKDAKLGQWVSWTRKKYSNSELTPDQVHALNQLPGWTWDVLESAWNEIFAAVAEISQVRDLFTVEKREVYKDLKVGQWIGVQRRNRETMSEDRKKLLESLRGWHWDALDALWWRNFALLQKQSAANGAQSVKSDAVIDGVKLGQWIGVQRRSKDVISPERRAALDSIQGWSWSPSKEKREKAIEALKDFSISNGHLQIPASATVDGINLYTWAARLKKSKQTLSDAERQVLEGLAGWSWV